MELLESVLMSLPPAHPITVQESRTYTFRDAVHSAFLLKDQAKTPRGGYMALRGAGPAVRFMLAEGRSECSRHAVERR